MFYRLSLISLFLFFQMMLFAIEPAPSIAEKTASVTLDADSQASPTANGSHSSGKWLPLPIFLTEPAFGYGCQ